MGICPSDHKDDEIDQKLQADFEAEQKIIKLLLLGPAESGKSTILKQMKIIHDKGYTLEERQDWRSTVHTNVLQGAASIIVGMRKFHIPFDNPKVENAVEGVQQSATSSSRICEAHTDELDRALVRAIKAIWTDGAVQRKLMPRNNEFQFATSTPYFLDDLDRIAQEDYVPTVQDILMLRMATTGITEFKFEIKTHNFRVFDVGGQRSERKKWIHCFDNVNAIIFIVAISEFDQTLVEDENINRMVESMRLFQAICNSKWFLKTAIILFLNKRDLFMEKIKKSSIKCLFNNYHGSNSYDDQIAYLEKKFEGLNDNPNKTLYMHETCATDTNQIQLILDNVIHLLLQNRAHSYGLC